MVVAYIYRDMSFGVCIKAVVLFHKARIMTLKAWVCAVTINGKVVITLGVQTVRKILTIHLESGGRVGVTQLSKRTEGTKSGYDTDLFNL